MRKEIWVWRERISLDLQDNQESLGPLDHREHRVRLIFDYSFQKMTIKKVVHKCFNKLRLYVYALDAHVVFVLRHACAADPAACVMEKGAPGPTGPPGLQGELGQKGNNPQFFQINMNHQLMILLFSVFISIVHLN